MASRDMFQSTGLHYALLVLLLVGATAGGQEVHPYLEVTALSLV